MSMHSFPRSIPSLVGGAWREGGAETSAVLDKFTSEPISEVSAASRTLVSEAVAIATSAARRGAPSAYERGAILERASARVAERREQLIGVMQAEAGFTLSDAENEVTRCIQTLRLCAEEARRLAGEMVPMEGAPAQVGRIGFTLRVPLGVVCAITPFNSPLNTVAHKIAPAFAAGNAVLLKPSLHTPFTANLLAEVLLEAGVSPEFLSVVHGGADVGQALLEEKGVDFFAFTGSTGVGRQIQARLGLRRSQMELGSIAHTIVDRESDLNRAIPRIVAAGYRKAGQVCTSVQILLVHKDAHSDVVARLKDQVSALPFGDPRAPGCIVGPLISEAAAQRVEAWIGEAVAQGATQLLGGGRKRSVVAPTLLVETTPDMRVRKEEVFGPVLCVVAFERFEEALQLISDSPYGLSVGVFTNSVQNAFLAARTIRAGAVHINEASSSRADLMPFGGSKDSGFGREGPRYAVREMTEEKLVTFA